MSNDISQFRSLVDRARSGDAAALDELLRKYENELNRVVKARLGNSLRPYFDSVDLVQSVHKSVVFGLRNDKFEIHSPEHLVRLAALIVRRKIARYWKRHQRQLRLDSDSRSSNCDDRSLANLILVSAQATVEPGEEVELQERLIRVLDRLEPIDRQLIEMRIEGFSTADAARNLQIDSDILRARLGRVRRKLRSCGIADDWM